MRATKKHSNLQVAIKRCYIEDLDTPHHAYILRELRIMGCLHHPNLIQIKEACLWDDHLWMCMELMSCSVFNLLYNTTVGLSEGNAVRVAREASPPFFFLLLHVVLTYVYPISLVLRGIGLSSLQELHAS